MNDLLNRFREDMKEMGTRMFLSMMEEEYGNVSLDCNINVEEKADTKKIKADLKAAADEYTEDIESCVSAFIEDFIWQCDCAVSDFSFDGETEAASLIQEKKDKLFDRDILKKIYTNTNVKREYEKALNEVVFEDDKTCENGLKQAGLMYGNRVVAIHMEGINQFCNQIERKLDKIFK